MIQGRRKPCMDFGSSRRGPEAWFMVAQVA